MTVITMSRNELTRLRVLIDIRPVAKVALTAGSRPRRMLEWRA